MKRDKATGIVLAAGVLALSCAVVQAAIIEDWATDDANWTLTADGGGGGAGVAAWSGGYLEITADTLGSGPPPPTDVVFADSGTDGASGDALNTGVSYAGNVDYTGPLVDGGKPVGSVTFDFYSDAGVGTPEELTVFFTSNGHTWFYDVHTALSPTLATGWDTVGAAFSYANWYEAEGGYGSSADFAAALTDVDAIGLKILYQDANGQIYGLDNWTLNGQIPEPGTYAMLVAAFMSLGISFRGKLRDVLGMLGLSK